MEEYLEHTYDKFIFRIKVAYRYSKDDFWVDLRSDPAPIGVTDFLQKARGDVAFLETVEPGTVVEHGQEVGKIETIKATFGIASPVTGTIVEVNPDLEASPFLINQDPYGAGWIYKVHVSTPATEAGNLLAAPEYLEVMKEKVIQEAKGK
jgi:glycine cleavage system H protein